MKSTKQTDVTPIWRNKKVVPILLQIAFAIVVLASIFFLFSNAISGLRQMGMSLGFGFLSNTAGFAISETMIDYAPTDTYAKAFLVGILSTLRVAFFGIILASIVGLIVGLAGLSKNWLLSRLAIGYIEIFRNTPLLVQIFIWFYAVFLVMPQIQEAVKIGPIFISNRGTAVPWIEINSGSLIWLILFFIGGIAAIIVYKKMLSKGLESGKRTFPSLWAIGVLAVASLVAFLISFTPPVDLSIPNVDGRGFVGGYTLSVGFSALLIALVVYTSTFIAEIVRAGIQGVHKGQKEAAMALGLKNSTAMRLVIFPQAIRIIIPPLTSQYLNLTKNSSLAAAIGYQEVVHVGGTIMNQTGRAIEAIIVMMLVYLTLNLITSLIMNIFNKKTQLVER